MFYYKSFILYKGDEIFNSVEDFINVVKVGIIDMGIYLLLDVK